MELGCKARLEKEWRLRNTYAGVHMNATHGALHLHLLSHRREVADHVRAECLIINGGGVHRVFPEQVVIDGQMGQHDDGAALQGETSVRVPSLGELSVQVGQGVEVGAKLGDQSSRPLNPERLTDQI